MNNNIKTIKAQALAQFKQQKANLEAQKEQKIVQRFSVKKQAVDEENMRIDQSFEKYRTEKLAAYNQEINIKNEEVQAKKAKNIENAKVEARTEIEAEVANEIMEYDVEISKLEKELA